MKKLIDSLNNLTDWNINSPSELSLNEHSEFIAGLNNQSIMIKFDKNDIVKKAYKVFSEVFDVTNYDTLILNIWSQNFRKAGYNSSLDFVYKIKINNINEFYLPIFQTFTSINIGIEDIIEISQIEITALHNQTDYIIISEMVAEKEKLDFDVMNAVKEHLDYYIKKDLGDGLLITTASGIFNNSYISILNSPKYLEKYAVIKIDNGINSEIHQIDDTDGTIFNFNDNYDGKTLKYNHTNSNIILMFPVYFNPGQLEIRLPGIAIWGIDATPVLRGSKLDNFIDTYSVENATFKSRPDGQILNYSILIDIEARSNELLTTMANIVKKFIAGEVLWINGRYHEINFSGRPTEQRALEGVDVIPKIQYSLDVEAKMSIYDRIALPKTTVINLDVDIMEV